MKCKNKLQRVINDIIKKTEIVGSWGSLIGSKGIDINPEGKNQGIVLKIYEELKIEKKMKGTKDNNVFITSDEIKEKLSDYLKKNLTINPPLVEYLEAHQEERENFAKKLATKKNQDNTSKVIKEVISIIKNNMKDLNTDIKQANTKAHKSDLSKNNLSI